MQRRRINMKGVDIEDKLQQYIGNNYNLPSNIVPIIQISVSAKILIIGPAPGIRAHNSGTPWNDASGERLRDWLSVSMDEFYDKNKFALVSMNFWYPGINERGGDNPPNIELAEKWHRPLIQLLPNIELTLLIGRYAQIYILKKNSKFSLTKTVESWREYLPELITLPHPSWHNSNWIKKHSWFEIELLPELRKRVRDILDA